MQKKKKKQNKERGAQINQQISKNISKIFQYPKMIYLAKYQNKMGIKMHDKYITFSKYNLSWLD
jgi:hypothetical protein